MQLLCHLFVVTVLPVCCLSMELNVGPEREAQAKLFDDLAKHRVFNTQLKPLPVRNANVTFLIWLFKIYNVVEATQTLETGIFFTMYWKDPDLRWEPSDYGNTSRVMIPSNRIWYPFLYLSNSADQEENHLDDPGYVELSHDGTVRFQNSLVVKTHCDFNLIYYPFDTQICKIVAQTNGIDQIGTGSTVGFTNSYISERVSEYFYVDGEWTLEKTGASLFFESHNFLFIEIDITISRASLFYVLCMLMPMIITSLLTLFVFLIPPESGEKISYLVSIYLSTAFYLSFAGDTLPRNIKTGIDAPRVTHFLTFVIVECVMSLAATVFVMRRHKQEQLAISENPGEGSVSTSMENLQNASSPPCASDSEVRHGKLGGKRPGSLRQIFSRMFFSVGECLRFWKKKLGLCRGAPTSAAKLDFMFFCFFFAVSFPFYAAVFTI